MRERRGVFGNRRSFTDVTEKYGHREPQSRRDAIEWVALDIVGAKEGDPDLVSDGEQRTQPRFTEHTIASPVPW
jgi:hypothetical protein